MPKNINAIICYYITLEGIEKVKTEKMTTKQSEQSREHLQVEWRSFPLIENAQQLTRNYVILLFELQNLWKTCKESSTKRICKC